MGDFELFLNGNFHRVILPSPTGDKVTFYVTKDNKAQVWVLDLVKNAITAKIELFFTETDADPNTILSNYVGRHKMMQWSPDGNYLALAANLQSAEHSLLLYDFAAHEIRTLADHVQHIGLVDWSPDSHSIVYVTLPTLGPSVPYASTWGATIDGDYQPIADKLAELVSPKIRSGSIILDAGCGEGYYLQQLIQTMALTSEFQPNIMGYDISKWAVQAAARRFPAAWLVGMPDFPLDGELFAGRGKFNRIQGMIRDGWEGLSFHAFDVPSELPFAERVEILGKLSLPAHCELVKHEVITGTDEMKAAAWRVILSHGGEGVVDAASPVGEGIVHGQDETGRELSEGPARIHKGR